MKRTLKAISVRIPGSTGQLIDLLEQDQSPLKVSTRADDVVPPFTRSDIIRLALLAGLQLILDDEPLEL